MKNEIKNIKEFCNGIKYFEHIKLVDGCLYAVYGIKNKRKNLFNNIYDAVEFAYIHRNKLVKRFGCVCIIAYNPEDKIFNEKEYINHSIFEIKEAGESDVDILITADMSSHEISKCRNSIAVVTSDLSLKHDITVSVTVKPLSQFKQYADVLPYYKNVIREGIKYAV